jgi:hypothetical protein
MKLSSLPNQSKLVQKTFSKKVAQTTTKASKPIYFTGGLPVDKLVKTAAKESEEVIIKTGIGKKISTSIGKIFHKEPLVLKKPVLTAFDPSQLSGTINGQAVPFTQAVAAAAQAGVQVAVYPASQAAVQFAGSPAVQQAASNVAQQAGAAIAAIAAVFIGW